MNIMGTRLFVKTLFGLCICCLLFGCKDDTKDLVTENERKTTDEQYYANRFASEALGIYYYWNEEIAADLKKLDPETNTDPISTVNEIRYHQGETYIDKWTALIDDMSSVESSLQGVTTSYGYELLFYVNESGTAIYGVVAFVYADSPAEKAGLKRGDVIYALNGVTLNQNNYMDLYYTSQENLSVANFILTDDGYALDQSSSRDITLQAVEMYENPILCHKVLDVNGRKVAYLAYSSFDLNSVGPLIEICKEFKAEGVKDLILDLRYNGGGYVITESVIASMLAPQDVVSAGKVLETEEYNDILTEEYRKQGYTDFNTYFQTEYDYPSESFYANTKDANIGLEHIYALIGPNSASASEALLGGLMPYMPVTLIGEQSHGKYCTGLMLEVSNFYYNVPEAIKNWGLYVMISIYKNSAGETPCMPDGLIPDIVAYDNPLMTEQLGDENEVMLKTALQVIGKVYPETGSRAVSVPMLKAIPSHHKANFGKRIMLKEQLDALTSN